MTVPFPLRVSPDGRRLLSATGDPWLINGDAPWSIVVEPTHDEAMRYLDDRAARGITTLLVNLVENCFSQDPPRNRAGNLPFPEPHAFDRPVEAYFAHADRILAAARDRDMLVLLTPLHLGYEAPAEPTFRGSSQGFHEETLLAGVERCEMYGRWLGERYRDLGNVLWVLAGDRDPGDATAHVRATARGLRAAWPEALMTAHVHPDHPAREVLAGEEWLDVGCAYSYGVVHRAVLEDWKRQPPKPTFLFETAYEYMHNASRLQIRRNMWWSLLCGGNGHVLGVYPLWFFGAGWEDVLDSPGARDADAFGRITRRLPWAELSPDVDGRLLVSGAGSDTSLERAVAAVAEGWGMVYTPQRRALSLDVSAIVGDASVSAGWVDPATGTGVDHGTLSGTVTVEPPFPGDALLVLGR
jgi:hypothetical protein